MGCDGYRYGLRDRRRRRDGRPGRRDRGRQRIRVQWHGAGGGVPLQPANRDRDPQQQRCLPRRRRLHFRRPGADRAAGPARVHDKGLRRQGISGDNAGGGRRSAAGSPGVRQARAHRLRHRSLGRDRKRQHRTSQPQGNHCKALSSLTPTRSTNYERKRVMTDLPLSGIKVIDFTGVQAGPACTQMLAWFGADVLKVERTSGGDVTRRQLRDIPDVDALYFTMLNSNKRSLAIDTKTAGGLAVMEQLIRGADVLVENFAPGAMDRMGLSWERIQELNPGLVYGSVKGFNDDSRFADLKVYENVAQAAGGNASTTGFWDGPPTVAGAALGDSNTGMHLAIGILTALISREKTGRGQKVSVSMQDAVLNLCRVKLRDQQRLERVGYLEEYPQYPNGTFTDVVPRGGNAGGGGQPGWILKCKGWEDDPNAYIYFTIQEQNWARTCEAIGKPEWAEDPDYSTAEARQPRLFDIFDEIEVWLANKTKFEAVDVL